MTYPFHDTEDEVVEARLVRRARIHRDGHWLFIRPGQTWEDGDVRSFCPCQHCAHASHVPLSAERQHSQRRPLWPCQRCTHVFQVPWHSSQ